MTTLWMIWTCIWPFGAYFWIPLFEQQFIMHKTTRRIYDAWRIIFGTVWDRYSMKLENWSVNKKKSLVLSTAGFKDATWMSTSLLHSRAYQYSIAKVYVLSGSVLCLGKMGDDPVESWKSKIQWYSDNIYFKDLNRIDGQPLAFEWKICESSMRFNRWWENYSGNQRISQAGSFSCQCLTTLYGMQKKMMNCVKTIQRQLKSMLVDSLAVIGLSRGLDLKRSGTELTIANQMDLGIELQRKCCSTSNIPMYQPLGERTIKKHRRSIDTSTRRHTDKRESHMWWVEHSSSSVQRQPFELSLLCSEFQLDQLHKNDGEKDAGTKGGRKKCGKLEVYSEELFSHVPTCGKIKADEHEPDFNCLDKFLIREPSDCVEKPGDTQSIYRETWREGKKKIQNPTQRRVRKEGWKVHTLAGLSGWSNREPCRHKDENQESVGIFLIWIMERSPAKVWREAWYREWVC